MTRNQAESDLVVSIHSSRRWGAWRANPKDRRDAAEPTLETEVGEQRRILDALLALGELGKDQKPPPALAAADFDAFEADGQVVEVAFGDAASAHDSLGADVLVGEIEKGEDDADGEDPFRDLETDGGLQFRWPLVEG